MTSPRKRNPRSHMAITTRYRIARRFPYCSQGTCLSRNALRRPRFLVYAEFVAGNPFPSVPSELYQKSPSRQLIGVLYESPMFSQSVPCSFKQRMASAKTVVKLAT